MRTSRKSLITLPYDYAEWLLTMQPDPDGHSWGDTTSPLAGDTVVMPDGVIGYAMHTCPGRPPLPPGGMHRYVQVDGEVTTAWHISHLRPFAVATEIN